jgi:hypothetical protein
VATLASATQPAQRVARTGSGHVRDARYHRCAETEPEQSSPATWPVCGHDRTWKEEQTDFICDCKRFVLRFFLRNCTRLILGLGPQTKPPRMTAHHGLVTSHCITLILRGQTIKLLSKSTLIANPRKLGTLCTPTLHWPAIPNNMQHK